MDQAALATFKGVGEEDGKLIDYSKWGALGIFLPGGKDNLFTQGLKTHYGMSESRFRGDPIGFWSKTRDQLKLNPEERRQLENIQQQAQALKNLPARERLDQARQELPDFQSPLAQKIWAHQVSQEMPGLDEYNRTPNLPPQWKAFVQSWLSHQLNSPAT